MSKINIRLLAKQDIQEIVNYYDDISTKITDKFLDDLFKEFDFLVKNPHSFQVKYKNTRVRYLKQFPFGVHYLIQKNSIEILAVIHTSKNPKIWLKSN